MDNSIRWSFFKGYFDIPRVINVSKDSYNDEKSYWVDIGTNPDAFLLPILFVGCMGVGAISTTTSVNFEIKLTYLVEFGSREVHGPS